MRAIRLNYNGGSGGVMVTPTSQERTVEREHHVAPTAQQIAQHQSASQNKELLVSVNRGALPVAATRKPGDFTAKSVVPAKASGGHVEEATLKATPETMAPLRRARSQRLRLPAPHHNRHQIVLAKRHRRAESTPSSRSVPTCPTRPRLFNQSPQHSIHPRPKPEPPRDNEERLHP